MTVFLMDGVSYNVEVLNLTRKFSVLDTSTSGRTQNGQMYRDVIGTFFNYTMTVAVKNEDQEELQKFWDAICSPQVSHECVFPYGQKTLKQKMYVTSGDQKLERITNKNHWGEIKLNFISMEPGVIP